MGFSLEHITGPLGVFVFPFHPLWPPSPTPWMICKKGKIRLLKHLYSLCSEWCGVALKRQSRKWLNCETNLNGYKRKRMRQAFFFLPEVCGVNHVYTFCGKVLSRSSQGHETYPFSCSSLSGKNQINQAKGWPAQSSGWLLAAKTVQRSVMGFRVSQPGLKSWLQIWLQVELMNEAQFLHVKNRIYAFHKNNHFIKLLKITRG